MVRNEGAREYFKEAGLSYSDISYASICMLVAMLQARLEAHAKEQTSFAMNVHRNMQSKFDKKTGLVHCYITVDAYYFHKREGISFNDDGFIGFAGWADTTNTEPFVLAFKSWVDWIKSKKDAEAERSEPNG